MEERELKPGREIIEAALQAGAASLDEQAGKQFLTAYGIVVPAGETVTGVEAAVRTASNLGYPVVMKGSTGQVQHKTDLGLVILRVMNEIEVREAYRALETRAAAAGVELEGVLVERMVKGRREFMVGLSYDRLFGPVVLFGLGGIYTEALRDVALAVTPLSDKDAHDLLDIIEARALLGAFRGEPEVDREALVAVIMAVARMAQDHPEIGELDINPLVIENGAPVAVDALIAVGSPPSVSTRPPADLSRLDQLCAPRSVAVIGASSDTSKWGGMLIANLELGGFSGAIYPVNPKGGSILGLPAYTSLSELPEAPDLALIAVPASAVAQALEDCGRKGVKAVVVVSAGFSETGPEGREREEELVRIAERYGMGLVGPNCMGVINSHHRLYATGFLLLRPQPGGASMVSQSGNLGTQLLVSAERRKAGVGKFIGVGNEAMIDAVDFINYLRTDPQTNTIVAYIEGFDDGRRLLEVAKATTLEKPVVVLRGGMTDYGKKAAASHTGALTSSTAVFEAAARQSGMVVSTDPDEFMDLTFAFSYLPLPAGARVAVATMGGGWGVLVSDEIARCGLQLATLSPQVVADLDRLLPPYWSRSNPVDLVATITPGVPEAVVETLVGAAEVDAVLVMGLVGSLSESKRVQAELARLKEGLSGQAEAAHGPASGRLPGASQAYRGDVLGGSELEAVKAETEPARVEPEEPELSDREMAFIHRLTELMEHYCKPVLTISFKPLSQAVFFAEGRYASLVLPSPLRAVRVLAKMADYSRYLQANGRSLRC